WSSTRWPRQRSASITVPTSTLPAVTSGSGVWSAITTSKSPNVCPSRLASVTASAAGRSIVGTSTSTVATAGSAPRRRRVARRQPVHPLDQRGRAGLQRAGQDRDARAQPARHLGLGQVALRVVAALDVHVGPHLAEQLGRGVGLEQDDVV